MSEGKVQKFPYNLHDLGCETLRTCGEKERKQRWAISLTPSGGGEQKYKSILYSYTNIQGTCYPQAPPDLRRTPKQSHPGGGEGSRNCVGEAWCPGKAWILEADRQTCIQTLALPFNSCMTLGKSTSWKLFTFPVVLLWGWSETTCRESRSATVLCYGFLPCQVSLVISWGHTWGM